ncbi:MAG: hypothetical protein U0797_09045 [Gemmataceae bacterium]
MRQSGPVAEVARSAHDGGGGSASWAENVLPGPRSSAGPRVPAKFRVGGVRLLAWFELPPGAAHVAIRAEDVKLAGEDSDRPGPWNQLSGVVVSASPEGALDARDAYAPVSPTALVTRQEVGSELLLRPGEQCKVLIRVQAQATMRPGLGT